MSEVIMNATFSLQKVDFCYEKVENFHREVEISQHRGDL
jgi:hypothetical protein